MRGDFGGVLSMNYNCLTVFRLRFLNFSKDRHRDGVIYLWRAWTSSKEPMYMRSQLDDSTLNLFSKLQRIQYIGSSLIVKTA